MAIITREVCDVCGDERRPVEIYEVRHGEAAVRLALCVPEHAEPLERILVLGSPIPGKPPRVKVWDMEEIERLKAAQRLKEPRPL